MKVRATKNTITTSNIGSMWNFNKSNIFNKSNSATLIAQVTLDQLKLSCSDNSRNMKRGSSN